MTRCGKCGGCRRWADGDREAPCELTERSIRRYDPEGDWDRVYERLRALLDRFAAEGRA